MAERATIARPYAKAAFDYARGAKALAPWSKGLQAAAAIVADARLAEASKNPKLTEAQVIGVITGVAAAGKMLIRRLEIQDPRPLPAGDPQRAPMIRF